MNFLLDTHLLIWSALQNPKLSPKARLLISDLSNQLWFSTASLWETAIKSALKRPDFSIEVGQLRAGLLANGYREIAVEGRHVLVFRDLIPLHRDPFDRLLVAQAKSEGMALLTSDRQLAAYGDMVRFV